MKCSRVSYWRIVDRCVWSPRFFSFQGFSLLFFFLFPCPLPPENIFKTQQLVQQMFSQHTVQTVEQKTSISSSSHFLFTSLKKKKKEKCLSSYITLHSSKIKMKKPTKRRAPPQMMCHRSKEPFAVCQSVLVRVSRLLQARCGILPHTGSCQCCLG